MRFRISIVVLALAAFGSLVAAPAALAGTYSAEFCSPTANDGIEPSTAPQTVGIRTETCEPGNGGLLSQAARGTITQGAALWRLKAPEGTSIHTLAFNGSFTNAWDAHFNWLLTRANGSHLDEAIASAPADGHKEYTVDSSSITSELKCVLAPCIGPLPPQPASFVGFTHVSAAIEDNAAPTIALDPSLGTAAIHGKIQVPFTAKDRGGGISKVELSVDEAKQATLTDSNNSRCAAPFKFLAPCKLEIRSSFPLDTTKFPVDGLHTVKVLVTDAAGQTGQASARITVHNAPINTQLPQLTGKTKVGATSIATTGKWDGSPTSFAEQWLRCAKPAACAPIAGATHTSYIPVKADAGKRLVVQVTATNSFGSETALSSPSHVAAGGPKGTHGRPPQTTIAMHPRRRTARRLARFSFRSDQPGASFRCALDKGSFKPCRAPFKRKVKPGRHSFQVRAVSPAGVADPTPASFHWRVS